MLANDASAFLALAFDVEFMSYNVEPAPHRLRGAAVRAGPCCWAEAASRCGALTAGGRSRGKGGGWWGLEEEVLGEAGDTRRSTKQSISI